MSNAFKVILWELNSGFFAIFLVLSIFNDAVSADPVKRPVSLSDFAFLIGEWQGEAEFYFPRNDIGAVQKRSFKMECAYTLNATYIVCDYNQKGSADKSNQFRMYLTTASGKNSLQVLFLYEGRPLQVRYSMHPKSNARAYSGLNQFTDSKNQMINERIEWQISKDYQTIDWKEFNHLSTEPSGQWSHIYTGQMTKLDKTDHTG